MYKDGIPMPAVSEETVAPQALLEVVQCGCKAEGKLCETNSCSCRKKAMYRILQLLWYREVQEPLYNDTLR